MEIVSELTYLVDMESKSRGCEASVTARIWCGWVMFMECSDLQYEKKFPL